MFQHQQEPHHLSHHSDRDHPQHHRHHHHRQSHDYYSSRSSKQDPTTVSSKHLSSPPPPSRRWFPSPSRAAITRQPSHRHSQPQFYHQPNQHSLPSFHPSSRPATHHLERSSAAHLPPPCPRRKSTQISTAPCFPSTILPSVHLTLPPNSPPPILPPIPLLSPTRSPIKHFSTMDHDWSQSLVLSPPLHHHPHSPPSSPHNQRHHPLYRPPPSKSSPSSPIQLRHHQAILDSLHDQLFLDTLPSSPEQPASSPLSPNLADFPPNLSDSSYAHFKADHTLYVLGPASGANASVVNTATTIPHPTIGDPAQFVLSPTRCSTPSLSSPSTCSQHFIPPHPCPDPSDSSSSQSACHVRPTPHPEPPLIDSSRKSRSLAPIQYSLSTPHLPYLAPDPPTQLTLPLPTSHTKLSEANRAQAHLSTQTPPQFIFDDPAKIRARKTSYQSPRHRSPPAPSEGRLTFASPVATHNPSTSNQTSSIPINNPLTELRKFLNSTFINSHSSNSSSPDLRADDTPPSQTSGARLPTSPSNAPNQASRSLLGSRCSFSRNRSLSRSKTPPKHVICSKCEGRGGKAGSVKTCAGCKGSGVKTIFRQMGPMVQQLQQTCSECQGNGESINPKDRCKECEGAKVVRERKVLEVHIEKGMRDGQTIVFRGEADQAPGVTPGDVEIVISEKPHPVFKRKEDDLITEVEIDLVTALTGGVIPIEHLDQRALLVKVNPGEVIKPNATKLVPGNGMPSPRFHTPGDLLISIKICFPDSIPPEACPTLQVLLPPPRPLPQWSDDIHVEEVTMVDASEARTKSRANGDEMDEDEDPRGDQPHVQCAQQ